MVRGLHEPILFGTPVAKLSPHVHDHRVQAERSPWKGIDLPQARVGATQTRPFIGHRSYAVCVWLVYMPSGTSTTPCVSLSNPTGFIDSFPCNHRLVLARVPRKEGGSSACDSVDPWTDFG